MQTLLFQAKGSALCPLKFAPSCGFRSGTKLHFELRGLEIVVKAELPMSAYYGMLKGCNLDPADLVLKKSWIGSLDERR